VVTLVSCLPVVALALGTGLAHLLHAPGEDVPDALAEDVSTPVPGIGSGTVSEDVPDEVPTPASASALETVSASVLEEAPIPAPASTGQAVAPKRAPRKRNTRHASAC
jgi:hypothetical protein